MCGICGEIRFDDQIASTDRIQSMMKVLEPRGPEGSGVFNTPRFAFGHRRLKIVDLSDRGGQPMVDEGLGLGLVYNGMLYNYKELRRELEGKGHSFFSTSDTEVILKSYAEWGEEMVHRFNGMFAFAIWDNKSGDVLLGRDRLGIKPLYYSESNGALRFASTLPALLRGGDVDTSIDPVGLHYYLSFHAVVPAPHTILNGVRKLPPASLMRIKPDGSRVMRQYWSLQYKDQLHVSDYSTPPAEAEEWRERLLDALDLAVHRRIVADVPVGVLLSGGLDSSLVVALLRRKGQGGLNTFSIGFQSVGGEKGDEFEYSDIVAQHFETKHHKIFIEDAEALPALIDTVQAMAEPMVSHDCMGFYLLSREVSKHLKVVQSGQGADEVFAGYHWYPAMVGAADPVEQYASVFFDRTHEEFARIIQPEFVSQDFSRDFVRSHFAQPGIAQAINKALRLDTTIMLVDDPVKRVDNMTMAWALEARVPFLDHELVELAAEIPWDLKLADGGKGILKDVGRKLLPHEVIDRPKGYFPVPALKYLKGEYFDFVKGVLDAPVAQDRGVFKREYIDELLAAPEEHITPLRGSKLWQIALLELWLQQNGL